MIMMIMLLTSFILADCDFMAMISRDGTIISDFIDPDDTNQYDYNSVEDYFEFLKQHSNYIFAK